MSFSGIHAEGYPAAEMKHGPIALIDPFMTVIIICTKDFIYDKVCSGAVFFAALNCLLHHVNLLELHV